MLSEPILQASQRLIPVFCGYLPSKLRKGVSEGVRKGVQDPLRRHISHFDILHFTRCFPLRCTCADMRSRFNFILDLLQIRSKDWPLDPGSLSFVREGRSERVSVGRQIARHRRLRRTKLSQHCRDLRPWTRLLEYGSFGGGGGFLLVNFGLSHVSQDHNLFWVSFDNIFVLFVHFTVPGVLDDCFFVPHFVWWSHFSHFLKSREFNTDNSALFSQKHILIFSILPFSNSQNPHPVLL